MRALLPTMIFTAVAIAGCGDGGDECADPGAFEPAAGPLASPEALDRSGCVAGSLASLDPSGQWLVRTGDGPFDVAAPLWSLTCGEGLTVEPLSGDHYQVFTADDLFWRREQTFDSGFRFVIAYDFCRLDEAGVLHGSAARCTAFEGEPELSCGEPVPVSARRFGLRDEPAASGLALLADHGVADGAWPAAIDTAVRVVDGIAYATRGEDGLRIVDVSRPGTPVDLGHVPATGEAGVDFFNDVRMRVVGDRVYALIATSVWGALVYDVTDPAAPSQVARLGDDGGHTLFLEETAERALAYLADGRSPTVTIWDVTDPTAITMVGQYTVGGSPQEGPGVHDLHVVDGRAYLNATFGGMFVVDLQDPASPVEIGAWGPEVPQYSHVNWVTEAGGRKITVHGDEGYDAHVKIIDVDPESSEFLQVIGEYQTRPEVSVHNILAFGDRAYVAYYQDGVRVLDLSDPTRPTEIAHYQTWSPASSQGGYFEGALGMDVDLEAGILYVSNAPTGLTILQLE